MATPSRQLGLRSRVMLSYALGALVLSTAIALTVPALAQQRLLANTESAAQGQLWRNAQSLRRDISRALSVEEDEEQLTEVAIGSALDDLLRSNEARVLLLLPDDEPRSLSGLLESNIPASLVQVVESVGAGQQITSLEGTPELALGVQIGEINATYYELVPLTELNTTINTLRTILAALAALTTLAGALLGFYASRRLLQPLAEVATAAQAIARGRFDTELEVQTDPDLDRLSNSFNEMVEALRYRIERDERFASDVSHELRSPLMTLSASVEVLKSNQNDMSASASKAVDLLNLDVSRFQQLVEDLLEISQLDAGAIVIDRQPLHVGEFLHNVLELNSSDALLEHPKGSGDATIFGDKRRLAQVVTNLLTNARKYGGGATLVKFYELKRGSEELVTIEIIDAGPGVPASDRYRIFERFSRAGADAGRRETATGVGLGLSLVAEHVRLHDGRVFVTDRLDGQSGARFVIELPAHEHTGEDDFELAQTAEELAK